MMAPTSSSWQHATTTDVWADAPPIDSDGALLPQSCHATRAPSTARGPDNALPSPPSVGRRWPSLPPDPMQIHLRRFSMHSVNRSPVCHMTLGWCMYLKVNSSPRSG